jgi:hypothetical protein
MKVQGLVVLMVLATMMAVFGGASRAQEKLTGNDTFGESEALKKQNNGRHLSAKRILLVLNSWQSINFPFRKLGIDLMMSKCERC